MSNTLAIGAVTTALRQMLDDVASPLPGDPNPDPDLADAFVTTKPLDLARPDEGKNQLNLFLYQMQANAAFRNMDYSGTVHSGESGQQPLALNLYYVLTAYGKDANDIKAHRLLGRAMSILHDNSTIPRDALKTAMPTCDIWQQVERVRVRPHSLTTDELSKLWTGFSKPYRVSVAYEVSVVLIESTKPAIAGLPVLTRGKPVGGIEPGPRVSPSLDLPYPTLEGFEAPKKRPAARLGETITFSGKNLGGTPLVAHFQHRLLAQPNDLVPVGPHSATTFQIQIPNTPTAWPAGLYTVHVDVTSDQNRTTNALPFVLAPQITSIAKVISTPTELLLSIGCTPQVREDQKVFLIVGDRQVASEPHGDTTTLQFNLSKPPVGLTYVRLRVDGVDSLLVTDFTVTPPTYDPTQSVTLP
jgi:hypothetical protein